MLRYGIIIQYSTGVGKETKLWKGSFQSENDQAAQSQGTRLWNSFAGGKKISGNVFRDNCGYKISITSFNLSKHRRKKWR